MSRSWAALKCRPHLATEISAVPAYNPDLVEVDWRDRGAVAVKDMAWGLYDDLYCHFAVGLHAFSPQTRRAVARWVLFLQSQEEYLWPDYSFARIVPGIANILTFGWWKRREAQRWQEFTEAGEFEHWPFLNHEQLQSAEAKCEFLGLSNRHSCRKASIGSSRAALRAGK